MNILCFIIGWLFSCTIALIAIPLFWIRPEWGQVCHRLFGSVNLWIMDIRVSVHGIENLAGSEGAILAPNHESLFDILVIASLPVQKAWVAKRQIKYIPFIGQVLQAMGSHFVTRTRSEKDIRVLGEVEEALQKGARIVIFPEGTRTRTGEMLPFKKGAFRTAMNAGVPLIPIALRGTFQIAQPGHLPTRGHSVVMKIGKPMMANKDEKIEQYMERYKTELLQLLTER